MKHSTTQKSKFKKLQRRLGTTLRETVGTLELLWVATQVNAPRGDIGSLDSEEIAIECDWPGDPDRLVDALIETGWLDIHPTHRLVVHDWHEHAPRYVKGIAAKKGGLIETNATQGPRPKVDDPGSTTLGGRQPNLTKPNLTKPNLTKPNLTKPNQKSTSYSCPEPESPGSEPAVMTFPVKGKTKTWNLHQAKIDEWREAFSGADVLAELRKARQWLIDNPKRQKTNRGMHSFLFRWLERSQNSGRIAAESDNQSQTERSEYRKRMAETQARREAAEKSRQEAAEIARQSVPTGVGQIFKEV